jgi:hypothetical protein
VNASVIELANCFVVAATTNSKVFAAAPSSVGYVDLSILYAAATGQNTETLSQLDGAFVHIQDISSFPGNDRWRFCIFNRTFALR